jgi:hypothetical protein
VVSQLIKKFPHFMEPEGLLPSSWKPSPDDVLSPIRPPHAFPGGRDSHSLWIERSGDQIPLGVRFFVCVQTDPGVHPAPCARRTGSFPGVKRSGSGVDHPPQFSAEVEEKVELYLHSSSGPSWHVIGWTLHAFPFCLFKICVSNILYSCLQVFQVASLL